jgi:hypothetical protein
VHRLRDKKVVGVFVRFFVRRFKAVQRTLQNATSSSWAHGRQAEPGLMQNMNLKEGKIQIARLRGRVCRTVHVTAPAVKHCQTGSTLMPAKGMIRT